MRADVTAALQRGLGAEEAPLHSPWSMQNLTCDQETDCSVELPKSWKPLLPVIFLAGTLQGSFLPLGAALVHSSCKLKGKGFSDLPTRSRNLATPSESL